MSDPADEASQQRREMVLSELRVLVATLDREEASRQHASTTSSLAQLVVLSAFLWTPPVTCALTVFVAIALSPLAAYAFAIVEIAGALVLRARHLTHHWWRHGLYGVALAVLMIAIS